MNRYKTSPLFFATNKRGGTLIGTSVYYLLYLYPYNEVPPWYALLGGVAGTVGTKVLLLFEEAKHFERNCYFEAHFDVYYAVISGKRDIFYGLTFFVGDYLYICKLTYIK